MDRAQMIGELEEYWYRLEAEIGEEVGDIPSAIQYYWSLPYPHLVWEYEEKIGCPNGSLTV